MTTRRQLFAAGAGLAVLATGSTAVLAAPVTSTAAPVDPIVTENPLEMQNNVGPRGDVVRRGSRGYYRRRWRNRAMRRRYWRRRAWRRGW